MGVMLNDTVLVPTKPPFPTMVTWAFPTALLFAKVLVNGTATNFPVPDWDSNQVPCPKI